MPTRSRYGKQPDSDQPVDSSPGREDNSRTVQQHQHSWDDTAVCNRLAGKSDRSVGFEQGTATKKSLYIVAAIAVISVVAVGLLTLWAVFVIRGRRRGSKQTQFLEAARGAQESALEKNKTGSRQTRIYEMHSESRPFEAPGSDATVYEMEGRAIR